MPPGTVILFGGASPRERPPKALLALAAPKIQKWRYFLGCVWGDLFYLALWEVILCFLMLLVSFFKDTQRPDFTWLGRLVLPIQIAFSPSLLFYN